MFYFKNSNSFGAPTAKVYFAYLDCSETTVSVKVHTNLTDSRFFTKNSPLL